MKLNRRIAQVWNWLPAFRAVAESEHLPTASREANLSASALSRAVRLLEDDLGIELFVREGRQLELTAAGKNLLVATRQAMRTLEAALDRVLASETSGPVHIAAPAPFLTLFVLPALARAREAHPEIVPHVTSLGGAFALKALHEGAVDIVLEDDPLRAPDVRVSKLCELGWSVWVSAEHPLANRAEITSRDLEAHPFVGPSEGALDHWPPHLSRRVTMVVQELHVAVEACAVFGLCAMLPDVIAETRGGLRRLPIDLVPPRPLYALSRKAAAEPLRTDLVLHALQTTVTERVEAGPAPIRSTLRPPPMPEALEDLPTVRDLKRA